MMVDMYVTVSLGMFLYLVQQPTVQVSLIDGYLLVNIALCPVQRKIVITLTHIHYIEFASGMDECDPESTHYSIINESLTCVCRSGYAAPLTGLTTFCIGLK